MLSMAQSRPFAGMVELKRRFDGMYAFTFTDGDWGRVKDARDILKVSPLSNNEYTS
jgi:asparagine synthetase B (glutamine-hydrolysing)